MHSKRMHSRYTQHEHGRRKRDNASMHASTKHGPAHPRDVDDVDERMPAQSGRTPRDIDDVDEQMPHDLDECCTSTPRDQHEVVQHGHAQQWHAQQAHETRAQARKAKTGRWA